MSDNHTQILFNYSPSVDLRLEVKGQTWPLAKTGRDHFVPAERFNLKPCDGVIIVRIDGKEHRSKVNVVNGVCFFDSRVTIRRS
ncbi:MAG TPA: hypothetical protein VFG04_01850 [Planctomycetaceae bacterium]|jgi:hypothetical protein|nr:hypothetical protein [Planctomycetaceae bacterium]